MPSAENDAGCTCDSRRPHYHRAALERAYDAGVRDMSRALQGGSEPVNPYRVLPPGGGRTLQEIVDTQDELADHFERLHPHECPGCHAMPFGKHAPDCTFVNPPGGDHA